MCALLRESNILDGNHIITLNWKNHLLKFFPSSLSEFVGLKNHYPRVVQPMGTRSIFTHYVMD